MTYPVLLLALIALCEDEIRQITYQLETKQITLDEWLAGMTRILMRFSIAAVLLGADSEEVTEQVQDAAIENVKRQVGFLDSFAEEITGHEWESGWNSRAESYADSIQVGFWKGFTHFLKLPAYPGDGSSLCLQNDRCMWNLDWIDEEKLDVDAYWVTEKDNKVCATCEIRGIKWSPLRVRDGEYSGAELEIA